MQLQITKNEKVNKFSTITNIESAIVPYLSFNNEYFLNLELSQEADYNFKINNKYFKVIMAPAGTKAEHVMGMVLAQEGGGSGTWVRVDRDFNTVEFNPEHGTWAGIKQVINDTYGEFTEIPITWVKTETLIKGPYTGKNCWWIADGPEDGFHIHPAFIGRDGKPHPLQIASWIISNKDNVPFSEDKGKYNNNYWTGMSYEVLHKKSWMQEDARPYNIYDHHFLVRMMITEFGRTDIQNVTVDNVSWNSNNRTVYHGMHDLFGLATDQTTDIRLDGLSIQYSKYQLLATDGSLSMVDTGIMRTNNDGGWIINCRIDKVNGIDFGDIFIGNENSSDKNLGSFSSYQALKNYCDYVVSWNSTYRGSAFLSISESPLTSKYWCWRISRCGTETDPIQEEPKKNIKSIQSITKSVDYGTTFENIGLPNAVVVTLDDDTTVDLSITWSSSSYVSTQSGSQTITGTLVLTNSLTNTNNLTAIAVVTVAEQTIDPVNNDDWSLQFTLGTVESEVLLSNIQGFSEKDTPADTDFYGENYDNQGRHLEIRYLGTQGNLTYAPDGVAVPNSCSSEEEQAAAINPDGYADYDPEAGNIMFSGGSAGTKVYMLVYHSEPFNS